MPSSRFDRVTSVPAGRPVPESADLRLLAELSRSGSIGLPQAAWQAGMTQAEAAARMVSMAEAGLPLRLVAEGDRALLWQIVQRAPAASPPPDTPGAAPLSAQSVWGLPGDASWTTRGDQPGAAPAAAGPPVGHAQRTVGLSGEQVTVTVAEVIDPGNDILSAAGYHLDNGERAVLVRTTLANAGPAPHDCMPDLYLFLVDAAGRTLPKAPVAVAGHPAHRVGVRPGAQADGWTIFLIDAATDLRGVRWCVRPDLIDRTLTWSV